MSDNDSRLIRYSVGRASNLGKVENKADSWAAFKALFKNPPRTSETMRAYLKMTDLEQKNLKAIEGYFFRSQVTKNDEGKFQRTRGSGLPSDILTFDFDYPTVEFFERAKRGELLPGVEHFIQTSRRHTPEKPRFRLIVVVSSPVSTDFYPAVSRIIARTMDPGMEFVDPVSFRPAQMMFFPTLCADSEFVFREFEGSLLNYQTGLDQFEMLEGDWHDITLLPRTVGEGKLRETSEKAENPLTKAGIVGTFCRAYSIEDAIAKFLPEVYTPVDLPSRKPRYTYALGTTVNGAEVQDDGLFLYSHHGSDPCSDQLVNAFDLVRIHLYGKQDKDFDPEKKITEHPSWKSMVEFVKTDPGFKKQQTSENFDLDAMLDDLVDEDRAEIDLATVHAVADDLLGDLNGHTLRGDRPAIKLQADATPIRIDHAKRKALAPKDWLTQLETTQQGLIKPTLANLVDILTYDPRFAGTLAFNEFTHQPCVVLPIHHKFPNFLKVNLEDRLSGDLYSENHRVLIRAILGAESGTNKTGWGLSVSNDLLADAVLMVSRKNTFNPVRTVLESFEWDGVPRVESMTIRYLGCPDTPYYRDTSRLFMVAAVARIFEPGCKFDFMPVLHGPQGVRKSTFIETLALGWFGSLQAKFDNIQKLMEQLMGNWIMENAELAAMVRSGIEDIKAFLSERATQVRMPYEATPSVFKRQSVCMGSTNDERFLRDPTGNRRFWPWAVLVDSIDTDALRREVAQLYAEAVVLYRAMRAAQPTGDLPLFLTGKAKATAEALQETARKQDDSDLLAEALQSYLDKTSDYDSEEKTHRTRVTISELMPIVYQLGFRIPPGAGASVIGLALKNAGWVHAGRVDRNATTAYVPGASVLERWNLEDAQKEKP